jgi:HlyD family secretion protein
MTPQRLIVVGLLLAATALAAFLIVAPRFRATTTLSGYIEGEPLYPASPLSGRLVSINVQRGDSVAANQPLFAIDPSQGDASRDQATAELAAAKALAADARRGQRPAELGVFEADVAAARAQLIEAQRNLSRVQPLAEAGAASRAALDSAISARDTASAAARAAEKRLQAAKLGGREYQIRAADDRITQAEAGLSAAEARLNDLAPVAPTAGRIEDVFFQAGEWVPANQPVLSLLPTNRVRLRFFVPQERVAAYTIGRDITYTCDGCAKNMSATITYVAPRPEFTPPVIYSRDARDRLVFLVEAQPSPSEALVPGLPIDVKPLKPAQQAAAK